MDFDVCTYVSDKGDGTVVECVQALPLVGPCPLMRFDVIDVVVVGCVLCCCRWLDASYVVAFDVFE